MVFFRIFAPNLISNHSLEVFVFFILLYKITTMSDHIENEGKKGKFLLKIFLAFLLFIITWVSIYRANFQMEF